MMTTKYLTEVTKGVREALCGFPRTLAFLLTIILSTSVSSLALAQILIDYDDGDAGNGIHDASILNGGFEDNVVPDPGDPGSRLNYSDVSFWVNLSTADQTLNDFVRNNQET